jgi:hypothetical protein
VIVLAYLCTTLGSLELGAWSLGAYQSPLAWEQLVQVHSGPMVMTVLDEDSRGMMVYLALFVDDIVYC